MYRRRRVTTVLPSSRRHGAAGMTDSFRSINVDDMETSVNPTCTERGRRSIGASYISSSSSSSSSRSSSPGVGVPIYPLRRSTRSEAQITNQVLQATRGPSRSRRRTNALLGSTNSTSSGDLNSTASNSVSRCALPVSIKPTARGRRRPPLLSPIFQFILSPENSCSNPNSRTSTDTSVSHRRGRHDRACDNGQFGARRTGEELIQPPGRSRTTRPRSRTTGLARSSQISNCAAPSSVAIRRNLGTNASRRSRSAAETSEIQAALAAARNNGSEPEDDCVICLCTKSNRSIVLPCMHTFCFDCIHRWLCINPSCPLCKRVAQRIIHSILSDTEFTEVLVSDLRPPGNRRRVTGLSPDFDLEEEFLSSRADDANNPQSHHHYHYHLGTPSAQIFGYLGGMHRGSSAGAPFFFPPIFIPAESRPTSVTGLLEGEHRISYRFNPEFGSPSESRRTLLTGLVNGALRPRDSSLLDGLLLRQLVYVFGFESIPVTEDPELERDIRPEFLAANESQQQRLQAFVRRELRAIAPWLAYQCEARSDGNSVSSQRTGPARSHEEQTPLALTAPLICGAPGLLAHTRDLDDLTERVVLHCTSVSMTDEQSLVDLLSSQPALAPPLVPTNYLSHFAAELLQFARYSGTLEQYDSAVCLYRRRLNAGVVISGQSRPRQLRASARPDPRLAVYVASACWPRLRPGFSQPQGLITHPLINWLLQRLFVHAVSGTSHPAWLAGTGEYPSALAEPLVFHSSPAVCHPSCLRLSSLSRALLEALPPPPALSRTLRRPGSSSRTTVVQSGLSGSNSSSSSNIFEGGMTTMELFPSRLLYQRILSELIDQCRFSEALAAYFSQSTQSNASSSSLQMEQHQDHNYGLTDTSLSSAESSTASLSSVNNLQTALQPAIRGHSFALRRLNGLLLLFTARIPGMGVDTEEDFVSELLHMPLLPMTVPSPVPTPVIDLTSPSVTVNRSRSQSILSQPTNEPSDSVETADHVQSTDWNFLRQLPSVSLRSVGFRPVMGSTEVTNRPSSPVALDHSPTVERISVGSDTHTPGTLMLNNLEPTASHSSVNTRCTQSNSLATKDSFGSRETGWRNSPRCCVVISSDSSSDEEAEQNRGDHDYDLTPDDSDHDDESAQPSPGGHLTAFSSLTSTLDATEQKGEPEESRVIINNASESIPSTSSGFLKRTAQACDNPSVRDVEDTTSMLSLDPCCAEVKRSRVDKPHEEEPMEVDEHPDDPFPSSAAVCSGSKRCSDIITSQSGGKQDDLKPAKVPKFVTSSDIKEDCRVFLSPLAEHLPYPNQTYPPNSASSGEHRRSRRQVRSRSPISVKSSDSDCEFLRESIKLDSDSSRSSSVYSSSYSTSSRSSSSSSRSRSGSSHSHRKNHMKPKSRWLYCHRCQKHRKRRHHSRHHKRGCHRCHDSKRHRRLMKHGISHRCTHRRVHGRQIHRTAAVLVNRSSSPICISDDNDENDGTRVPAEYHTQSPARSPLSTHDRNTDEHTNVSTDSFVPTVTDHVETPVFNAPNNSGTPEASCSYLSSANNVHRIEASEHEASMPNPAVLDCQIYEPSNLEEFYRYIERFDVLAHPPDTDRPKSPSVLPTPSPSIADHTEGTC
ncbi:unnamed protein product [Calicophoron daubneyi]|uniref:RING-type E3 ubiquitin transferase n=1 Tax=Calicophoron daubneyi TaxID=300641 RepID=A0AAV2TFI5_CALDB